MGPSYKDKLDLQALVLPTYSPPQNESTGLQGWFKKQKSLKEQQAGSLQMQGWSEATDGLISQVLHWKPGSWEQVFKGT